MIETLKEFALKLTAMVDKPALNEMTDAVDTTAASISDFAQKAIGVLTAGAFAMAVQDTVNRFNGLADAAARMGNITAKELDRLGYIADHTGSSADVASASFENLSKMIGEAANGVGGGAELFTKYGLSAKNADGSIKSVTQVLDELKAKMSKLSQSQKAAILQQMGMDKTLVDMVSTDTQALAYEYDKRTQLLGVNADEMGELSADFNDNLGKMTRSFSDVMTAVVVRILPPLTDAFKTVTRWITESGDKIVKIIEPFTAVIRVMVRLINGALVAVGSFIDIVGGLPGYLALATVAWKALNVVMNASPMVKAASLIAGVVSAIGLLIDDFKVAKAGGESFFQFWNEPWFDRFLKGAEGVISFFGNLENLLLSFGGTLSGVVVGIFTGDFALLEEQGLAFFDAFKGMWEGFRDFVWGIFDGLAGALEYAFQKFFPDAHETVTAFGDAISSAANTLLKAISDLFDKGLGELGDKVLGWVAGIGGKISGAIGGVKSFLGLGDDEKGGVLTPDSATVAAIAPTTYAQQSTMTNINNTVNQTFNVKSREEAGFLATKTPRLMGGAA